MSKPDLERPGVWAAHELRAARGVGDKFDAEADLGQRDDTEWRSSSGWPATKAGHFRLRLRLPEF